MRKKHYYLLPMVDFTITIDGPFGSMPSIPLSWNKGQKGAVAAFTNKRLAQRAARKLGLNPHDIITVSERANNGKESQIESGN